MTTTTTGLPKLKCEHDLEVVKSANGKTVYGDRCRKCRKQWQRSVCACGEVRAHVANSERVKWQCGACRMAEAKANA